MSANGDGDRKIDEIREFEHREERDAFIREFNSENTDMIIPNWYMVFYSGDDEDE